MKPLPPPPVHAIPRRIHFIPEWAGLRQKKQVDLMRETGADKGTVSRWFKGVIPTEDYLIALTDCLDAEEPSDLFRHPLDDWIVKFLRGRTVEERKRMVTTLESAFPRKG